MKKPISILLYEIEWLDEAQTNLDTPSWKTNFYTHSNFVLFSDVFLRTKKENNWVKLTTYKEKIITGK